MAGRRSLLGSLLVVVAALAGRVASGTLDGFRALMDEAVARMPCVAARNSVVLGICERA